MFFLKKQNAKSRHRFLFFLKASYFMDPGYYASIFRYVMIWDILVFKNKNLPISMGF